MNSNGTGTDILAISRDDISKEKPQILTDLDRNWHFGYLSYDLKNDFEKLYSKNASLFDLPNACFFQPDSILKFSGNKTETIKGSLDDLNISQSLHSLPNNSPQLIQRTSKEEYVENFDKIQFHIKRGDIYEINYCIEWYSENAQINPYIVYEKLNELTNAPFSSFLKMGELFVMCGSPERFIKKTKSKIISQPIKGTAKRSANKTNDELIKRSLKLSLKEKAENVMTTDVVRNDFSRIAEKASVVVSELAEIHSFKTVHHLISTIVAEVKEDKDFNDILRATFPMASMTGAPKISAMKISEELEDFKRGIYSGSIGYLDNKGDFDLNVVIRSIIYDQQTSHLSIPVGGAITAKSEAEQEYDECLVKAEAMFQALK